MTFIFEATDKTGRKIHLSKERWSHIRKNHSNLETYNIIEETINNPLKTIPFEEKITIFYSYFKDRKESKFLKAIVKYLNGEGYVITSYFVKNIG